MSTSETTKQTDSGNAPSVTPEIRLQRLLLEREAAAMNDEQVRYQVRTHELHEDHSWTFDVFVAEYRKRGLRERGDWQDDSETQLGA